MSSLPSTNKIETIVHSYHLCLVHCLMEKTFNISSLLWWSLKVFSLVNSFSGLYKTKKFHYILSLFVSLVSVEFCQIFTLYQMKWSYGFLFYSVSVVNHGYWCSNAEQTLHWWDKPHFLWTYFSNISKFNLLTFFSIFALF